jgi:hypothetical protein
MENSTPSKIEQIKNFRTELNTGIETENKRDLIYIKKCKVIMQKTNPDVSDKEVMQVFNDLRKFAGLIYNCMQHQQLIKQNKFEIETEIKSFPNTNQAYAASKRAA